MTGCILRCPILCMRITLVSSSGSHGSMSNVTEFLGASEAETFLLPTWSKLASAHGLFVTGETRCLSVGLHMWIS